MYVEPLNPQNLHGPSTTRPTHRAIRRLRGWGEHLYHPPWRSVRFAMGEPPPEITPDVGVIPALQEISDEKATEVAVGGWVMPQAFGAPSTGAPLERSVPLPNTFSKREVPAVLHAKREDGKTRVWVSGIDL